VGKERWQSEREAKPLAKISHSSVRAYSIGASKRGVSPLFFIRPPLLGKERGTQGVRSINNLTKIT
jgi:hypothetical protein